MTSRILTTAAAATLALGLAACGSDKGNDKADGALDTITAGTLTVCSDVPYPPFEDFDKTTPTGFKGFDIDIVTAVAKELKLKLVVKDSDFNALQSGLALNSRQCDLAASAMTITPVREKKIGFSEGYYDSEQSLLVPAGSSIKSIDDLKGKSVAVQKGTTGETYANKNATGAKVTSFPSDAQMYAAIKAGQVDAILQDLPVNLDHQKDPKQPGKFTVVETYKTDETYGLAMKKSNTDLIKAVDDALATLHSSGDYQKIYDSYFATK
ncbi:ABC transporter substrate-binding protein [Nocardioides jiangxiensis]|uniref:ABC transporter substrate-binding protein n=1 Tax=Nocardioides jiangxiensis TaxID=3064524 RepID=A0ABT9B762_9ACTN|nr:ABC transporter substrate-binding protein [Nocardioides sp. WY-20]MDO7868983.1 ABC transporter substrate-binding protein [Nocardioides sp. WY-20]